MPIKRRPSDDDDRPRSRRDEEDEKPTPRPAPRRARDEDEESDLPARTLAGRRAARDDDEDDEDERPARRDKTKDDSRDYDGSRKRAARDDEDDDEDEKPKPKRRAARDEDEDDDEDDKPAKRGGESVVKSGWGAAKRAREESGDFLQEFKFDPKGASTLVKFMQDEPFAVYKQHWIDSGLRSTKKKSFICMGNGCPLCKIGDKPDTKFAFNVAVLDAKDEPAVRALICGPRLLGDLETYNDGKTGPLTKHYWSLARSGKGSKTSYPAACVKSRDLVEDWEMDEDVIEDDLKQVKPYGPDDIQPMRRGELQALADELMGESDDDDEDDEDDRPRRRR